MRWPILLVFVVCSICLRSGAQLATTPEKAAPLESTNPGSDSFAGEWETTYGRMKLGGSAPDLHGTYAVPGQAPNKISGKQEGRKFTFTYEEPGVRGEGFFTLSPGDAAFEGKWRPAGREAWSAWSGRRAIAEPTSFSGVWNTDFGLMRLAQSGEKVTGCYAYGGRSTIEGTVTGDAFTFAYTEPDGTQGKGEFKLAASRESFAGKWAANGDSRNHPWKGTRVQPQPGREWLVVLEARWENSLQQPEYSYGEMLRQFFTRVPSVAVRHRTFTGRDEFARWTADLPYFAEPVILYVSSHGEKGGITVGNVVLDGKFIGEQLRFAPAVKLVHLGACLAMSGEVPNEIRKAVGANAPPVSGFTNFADWAGSAVIDFSYLDLILSRKFKPADAVKAARENILFARETGPPGGAIAPAGLKIVE